MVRDAWRPQAGRSQQVDRAVQAMAPGSVRGRIAEASPVRNPFVDQYVQDDTESEAAVPVEFMQDSFVLTKDGPQDVSLTYLPLDHSEHVYVNGLYQRAEVTWTRDSRKISLLATPYPPRNGDAVTVEYAYLPGPVPVEFAAPRGTPEAAWHESIDIGYGYDVQRCVAYVRFKEPIIDLGQSGSYPTRAAALNYVSGDMHAWSYKFKFYENAVGGGDASGASVYMNDGIPYTGWIKSLTGQIPDPHTFAFWTLYHTRDANQSHPHDLYGLQVYPYDQTLPPKGYTDIDRGIFWLGPQIPGQPKPWAPYGRND